MAQHISKINSDKFANAVKASLDEWTRSQRDFTVADVIKSARYPDGSRVGKNTLYSKNSQNKYVHEKLLSTVKVAAARSTMSPAPRSPACREGVGSAFDPTHAMGKQLLEQEDQILQVEAALAGANHHLQRLQEEALVIYAAMNHLSSGRLPELVRRVRILESSVGEEKRLFELLKEARSLANRCDRMRE